MVTRIVFELLESVSAAPEVWERAEALLRDCGAEHVRPPQAELPTVATAVLPDGADVDAVLDRLRALDGVGRAEPEAWRGTL